MAVREKKGGPIGFHVHSPIQNNPMFKPGTDNKSFVQWKDKGLDKFYKLYNEASGQLKPFTELQNAYQLPNNQIYQYIQIQSIILQEAKMDSNPQF